VEEENEKEEQRSHRTVDTERGVSVVLEENRQSFRNF
jgi:hypothetical protein